MKSCKYIENGTLDRYLLRDISQDEQIVFLDHLRHCDQCNAQLQKVRNLANSINDDEQQTTAKTRSLSFRRVAAYSAAACVVALLAMGGIWMTTDKNNTGTSTPPITADNNIHEWLKKRDPQSMAKSENYNGNDKLKLTAPTEDQTLQVDLSQNTMIQFKWENPDHDTYIVEIYGDTKTLYATESDSESGIEIDLSQSSTNYELLNWKLSLKSDTTLYKQGLISIKK